MIQPHLSRHSETADHEIDNIQQFGEREYLNWLLEMGYVVQSAHQN